MEIYGSLMGLSLAQPLRVLPSRSTFFEPLLRENAFWTLRDRFIQGESAKGEF